MVNMVGSVSKVLSPFLPYGQAKKQDPVVAPSPSVPTSPAPASPPVSVGPSPTSPLAPNPVPAPASAPVPTAVPAGASPSRPVAAISEYSDDPAAQPSSAPPVMVLTELYLQARQSRMSPAGNAMEVAIVRPDVAARAAPSEAKSRAEIIAAAAYGLVGDAGGTRADVLALLKTA